MVLAMAAVLVLAPWVNSKTGSGMVVMNILEALQKDHEVTLLTLYNPDLGELNDYFGTTVSDIRIRSSRLGSFIASIPNSLTSLWAAVLTRTFQQNIRDDYDLVVTDYNEFIFNRIHINYIHDPSSLESRTLKTNEFSPPFGHLSQAIWEFLQPNESVPPIALANSKWTANKAATTLRNRPAVLYPPVNTEDIEPLPWRERKDRIVTIGRIAPEKRTHKMIEIVAGLRERGYKLRHHIVGSVLGTSYGQRVQSLAAESDFVTLEGEVSRERLVELVSTSKYGLHGMAEEHFGIAIAELVAGGAFPFVPLGGGQTEVVGHCDALLYESPAEAVEL